MIYLLVPLVALALWHYVGRARKEGMAALLRAVGGTLAAGAIAGLGVAGGARLGMRLIAAANDAAPRVSLSGTSVVFVVFTGIGIGCAFLYAGVFRPWLRQSGLGYGALLVVATWYPLAHSGLQQLVVPMSRAALIGWSGAVVALMWVPYAWVLEKLLRRWERPRFPLRTGDAAA
jgi:hypothetical protein